MEKNITNVTFTVSVKEKGGTQSYEVVTCEGLAKELDTSRATINGYTRNIDPATLSTKLDYCFPHKTDKNKGPKYVIKNEKYEVFVKAYTRRKERKKSKIKG